MLKIKRIYLPAEDTDGYRILVDRLWPRGIKKENAKVDLWVKDVAPSTELREWFAHIPERFNEFKERYCAELKGNEAFANLVQVVQKHDTVTLLFSAKDEEHNNAVVLKDIIASSNGQG